MNEYRPMKWVLRQLHFFIVHDALVPFPESIKKLIPDGKQLQDRETNSEISGEQNVK